jgi:hypothetical protein
MTLGQSKLTSAMAALACSIYIVIWYFEFWVPSELTEICTRPEQIWCHQLLQVVSSMRAALSLYLLVYALALHFYQYRVERRVKESLMLQDEHADLSLRDVSPLLLKLQCGFIISIMFFCVGFAFTAYFTFGYPMNVENDDTCYTKYSYLYDMYTWLEMSTIPISLSYGGGIAVVMYQDHHYKTCCCSSQTEKSEVKREKHDRSVPVEERPLLIN